MFGSLRPIARAPRRLSLARLEAAVRLVDDVGAAAAADHAAIPVARLKRLQAIANLHGRAPARVSLYIVGKGPRRTGGPPRDGGRPSQGARPSAKPSCRRGFPPKQTSQENFGPAATGLRC